MKRIVLDLKRSRLYGFRSVIIFFSLLIALLVMSYALFHNPHQKLHEAVFATADNIRNFYRDEPGYWHLSIDNALQNSLVTGELLKYKDEYSLAIGEGINGEMGMPFDASFDIVLKKLNKSDCINLSELPVAKDQQLGLQKITLIHEEKVTEFSWGDENTPLPIAKYATRNICQMSDNIIIWTFQ